MPDAAFLTDLQQAYGTAVTAQHHFALAVSGGGDSMGLLALAAELVAQADAPRLSVLSVDHGLRAEAAQEIDAVAAACADYGLPHVRLLADKPLSSRDLQQQARTMRYRLMARWCADNQADGVLTAHHMQDQAETVLMRLARHSGLNGLGGMAARQNMMTEAGPVLILRPLLAHTRDFLRDMAAQAGLPMAQDPSNHDRRFERVRWRQALPKLQECGLDTKALVGLADDMRAIRLSLDKQLCDWLDTHAMWHDYGVLCLPRAAYLALSNEAQNRLMSAFIGFFGGLAHPPKRAAIAAFAARPLADGAGGATLGGAHLRWRSKTVFLGRETAAMPVMPASSLKPSRRLFDNRFFLSSPTQGPNVAGLTIAALGKAGVQALRTAGHCFDDGVPACYHTGLPAFFDQNGLVACPNIDPQTDFSAQSVYSDRLFGEILRGGRGW